MKVIKITPQQVTEWRTNASHLVSDEGEIKRILEPPLENALTAVVRTARMRSKSIEQVITAGPLQATVTVAVARTGRGSDEYTLEVHVDGLRLVSGREIIAARMLAEHGECQLRHPNGVILKVIRDPSIKRPTFAESMQLAPKPDHCSCATWGRPHPGTHYRSCPWNNIAPADERAPEASTDAALSHLPAQKYASLARQSHTMPVVATPDPKTTIAMPPPLDAPGVCRNQCYDWPTPKGVPVEPGQHHPTCVQAEPWARKTAKAAPRYLVDLTTGEKVRPASDQESGQASIALQRTGSPIVHIDATPYAVLSDTELESQTSVG